MSRAVPTTRKRQADEAFGEQKTMTSPVMSMFEKFKSELDEHHDRRERIIKASRDITAASKKLIFALQRVRKLREPLPNNIAKSNQQHWDAIAQAYKSIGSDLQGLNAHRYARNVTGGSQEFMEAFSFQHYLETQSLISLAESRSKVTSLGDDDALIPFTEADYILGIFDMTGELMRFAITTMATTGGAPRGDAGSELQVRGVPSDLRHIRALMQGLHVPHCVSWGKDMSRKMEVMQNSVTKVETSLYGLKVRGAERPKGWMPDERSITAEQLVV